MKKILLYVLDEERKNQASDLLKENNYDCIEYLDDRDINNYLGSYFGVSVDNIENTKNYEKVPDGEYMVLGNFDQDEIMDILKIFREKKIKRPITCSLTENNINWKIGELFSDLYLEDEYMKKEASKGNN